MIKKRCTDCKYTKGIGYDFWCGEGHTEYEVFGAETNCPYYEYYDWSKGTPSKTEKRFNVYYQNHEIVSVHNKGKPINIEQMVDCLNVLHEENQSLKKEIYLIYMRSMFNTVKSFKGDLGKRYKYDEETDTIYDTANHYGQYDKILDKKEIVMLLNEYNTLLGDNE